MGARGPRPKFRSEFRFTREVQRKIDKDPDFLPEHPITRRGGLLQQCRAKVTMYEGDFTSRVIAYKAFLLVFSDAPHKRIRSRINQAAARLCTARTELAELEGAARDCAGSSVQEREYVVTMRALKHGTPGWGAGKGIYDHVEVQEHKQHLRRNAKQQSYRARRLLKLRKLGYDLEKMILEVVLPFAHGANDAKILALKALATIMNQFVDQAKLLEVERETIMELKNRTAEDNAQKRRVVIERDALVRDIAALRGNAVNMCGDWVRSIIDKEI